MKKTFAILVVLLVAASLFAGYKAEMYAGANLGLNLASRTYKETSSVTTTETKFKETDFQIGGSFDYFFAENMGASAAIAVNAPMSASGTTSVQVGSASATSNPFDCDAKTGIVIAADFAYRYYMDKKTAIIGKAGLAVTTTTSEEKDVNATIKATVIAIDLKGEARYNLQDNLFVGGGVACDIPVSASTTVTVGSNTKKNEDKFSGFGFAAYAYAGMKF